MLLEIVAVLSTIYAILGAAKDTTVDVLKSALEITDRLPHILRILILFVMFIGLVGVLAFLTEAYNNTIGIQTGVRIIPCISNDTVSNFFNPPHPSMMTESEVCSSLGYDSITTSCVLLKLHPSCAECIMSDDINSAICRSENNLSTSSSLMGSIIYRSVYYGSPLGNYTKGSCAFAYIQGDADYIYNGYRTQCIQVNTNIAGLNISQDCVRQLSTEIDKRVKEISSQGVEYYNLDESIKAYERAQAKSTAELCEGIYLFDYQKWFVIGVIGYIVVLSLTWYQSIWQYILKR